MPKGSRSVQFDRGHVSITRATAEDVGLYCCVPLVSFLLELTVDQAAELGKALLDYASEAHHPDACSVCGRVNAKTFGCQCGEYETVWGVWLDLGDNQGDDLVSTWGTEAEAERELARVNETAERAAPGHCRYFIESFSEPVLPENGGPRMTRCFVCNDTQRVGVVTRGQDCLRSPCSGRYVGLYAADAHAAG